MPRKKKSRAGAPIKEKSAAEIEKDLEAILQSEQLDAIDKYILKIKSIDPQTDVRTIAKKLGVHHATIAYRLRKPKFRQAWDALMETTAQAMERNARRAAERLYYFINHKNDRIALEAIKLALSPYINQFTHQLNLAPTITYRTTVEPDSSLLQTVIEGELLPPKPEALESVDVACSNIPEEQHNGGDREV